MKIRRSIRTLIPKARPIWEGVGSSFTPSYIPKNIKCDSYVSLSTRTFVSPYLGHEPKMRVATIVYC